MKRARQLQERRCSEVIAAIARITARHWPSFEGAIDMPGRHDIFNSK
jgi:hypothetical protein